MYKQKSCFFDNDPRADDKIREYEEQKFGEIWDAEEKKGYSSDEAFDRATLIVRGIDPDAKEEEPEEDTRTNSEIFTDILKGYYSSAFGANK